MKKWLLTFYSRMLHLTIDGMRVKTFLKQQLQQQPRQHLHSQQQLNQPQRSLLLQQSHNPLLHLQRQEVEMQRQKQKEEKQSQRRRQRRRQRRKERRKETIRKTKVALLSTEQLS